MRGKCHFGGFWEKNVPSGENMSGRPCLIICSPQALRVWKARSKKPATAPSQDEVATWRQKLRGFFGRLGKAHPKARGEVGSVPMLANVHTARALDRSLLMSCSFGLAAFRPQGRGVWPLRPGESRFFLPAGELPAELVAEGQTTRACIKGPGEADTCLELQRCACKELHTMADCGSVGFGMTLWLHTRGGVCGTHCSDVFAHDCHNSVRRACVLSGCWLLVLEWTLCCNWTRAPFKSDANLEAFQQAAKDCFAFIASEECEDELWLAFYEEIAKSYGMWDDNVAYTKDHLAAVMHAAASDKCLHRQGDNVKLSRWFSFWDRFEEGLKTSSPVMLMVLIYISLHKDWGYHLSDDFMVYVLGSRAPLSATSTTLQPGDVAAERSVKASSDILKRLRSTCQNTEHTVATILANQLGRRLVCAMSTFIAVTRKYHGKSMVMAKTPRGALHSRITNAQGGW